MATTTLLYIDISELDDTIKFMKDVLEPDKFESFMYRTIKEVGKKVETLTPKAVQKEYEVTQRWVKGAMEKPQMSVGDGVQCIIPINGERGDIGDPFKASGGHRSKRGYKLKLRAHIVKGQRSTLPEKMSHQGGQPPWINSELAKGKHAFTRLTKERLPIAKVVGLGVPQMPLNRSKAEIQQKTIEYMKQRLEHNFDRLFSR